MSEMDRRFRRKSKSLCKQSVAVDAEVDVLFEAVASVAAGRQGRLYPGTSASAREKWIGRNVPTRRVASAVRIEGAGLGRHQGFGLGKDLVNSKWRSGFGRDFQAGQRGRWLSFVTAGR